MIPSIGIYEKALAASLDIDPMLAEARNAGFDFFELAIDESEERIARLRWPSKRQQGLARASAEAGIPIRVVTLSAHRAYPLGSASSETRALSRDMLARAIDLASAVGATSIQIAGYFVFYEPHHPRARQYFVEGLNEGLELAAQADVDLLLENVDGQDIISVSDALAIGEELDHPNFGLHLDLGNLAANGLNVIDQLQLARPALRAVDCKDANVGVYRRVDFGQGIVPFPQAFQTLGQAGFDGPLAVEIWNDDQDPTVTPGARAWLVDCWTRANHPGPESPTVTTPAETEQPSRIRSGSDDPSIPRE